MKKRLIFIIVILVAVVGFILQHPFNTKIHKEVVATVYVDGVNVEKTTIKISGEQSKTILSDEPSYIGYFGMSTTSALVGMICRQKLGGILAQICKASCIVRMLITPL